MMLRNRSRAFTSKPAAMVGQPSLLCPSRSFTCSPDSSLLGSPRFFNGYLSKHVPDSEIALVSSPVSILDSKNFVNLFDRNHSKSSTPSPEQRNHANRAIGLALIDSIVEEKNDELFNGNFSKPINRMLLLGSKLKVQIPVTYPSSAAAQSPVDSPKSPIEFGTKTRSPQVASPLCRSRHLIRQLSLKEMELSEDYTCVITHGPNPKTKHIFDEHIMENCCDDDDLHLLQVVNSTPETNTTNPSDSSSFISFCYSCNVNIHPDKELHMYRGEKANCCHECRVQETLLLEGMKKNQEVNTSDEQQGIFDEELDFFSSESLSV